MRFDYAGGVVVRDVIVKGYQVLGYTGCVRVVLVDRVIVQESFHVFSPTVTALRPIASPVISIAQISHFKQLKLSVCVWNPHFKSLKNAKQLAA